MHELWVDWWSPQGAPGVEDRRRSGGAIRFGGGVPAPWHESCGNPCRGGSFVRHHPLRDAPAMRVTNFSISDSAVLNLSALRGQVDAAQQQISSGKRFTEASADPAAAHGVMQNQSQLRAVTQYQRNVGLATSRATLEESALNQLGDILTRARELGIAQATGTASASTRGGNLRSVNRLRQVIVRPLGLLERG